MPIEDDPTSPNETITSDTSLSAGAHAVGSHRLLLCDATSGTITVTLTPASAMTGHLLTIKKIDNSVNAITIDGNNSETIEGTETKTLSSQYNSLTIASDGTNWHTLASV